MADPKLKFILEVDDKGSAVVKSFGSTLDHAGAKSKTFSTNLGGIATAAAKSIAKLTALGAAAATAVAGFTFTKVIGEFADFETQLTRLSNLGVADLAAIKQEIMALPPELGSATELVTGFYEVLSSGITDTRAAIDTLVTSSQLAKTAHLDQATAVKAVTAGMKAFDTDARSVADALMMMEKTGVTTVAQLANIFGEVAGTASAANISLDNTSASLAAITQMSGSTEKAATQMLGIIKEMLAPTAEMAKLFEEYGGTMGAIQQIGFDGVLKTIAEATGGSAEKINQLVTSQEALKGIVTLTTQDMRFFNEALAGQQEKAGALETAWGKYGETFKAIWESAKNLIGEQVILIGERLAPKVKEVVQDFTNWLRVNQEMIQTKLGAWIDEWSAKIGKVNFDKLAKDAMSFAEALGRIGEFFGKLFSPIDNVKKQLDNFFTETASRAKKLFSGDFAGLMAEMKNGWDTTITDMSGKLETLGDEMVIPPIDITANAAPAEAAIADVSHAIATLADGTVITLDADPSPADAAIDEVARSIVTLEDGTVITLDADPAPAITTVDALVADINSTEAAITVTANTGAAQADVSGLTDAISQMKATTANSATDVQQDIGTTTTALADIGNTVEETNDTVKTSWANVLEYAKAMSKLGDASEYAGTALYKYARMRDLAMQGHYTPAVAKYARMQDRFIAEQTTGSYADGTGPRGLPDTGFFQGHAGELLLSPAASAALASGHSAADMASLSSMITDMRTDGLYFGTRGQIVLNRQQTAAFKQNTRQPRAAAGTVMGSYAGGTDPGLRAPAARPGAGSAGAATVVNIYPTFMTGDAAGGRRAAAEIQRILDEHARRL
jgi:TP901 family phage tail tape measure protein